MMKLGINSFALDDRRVLYLIAKGVYSIGVCVNCGRGFAYNNKKAARRTCSKSCSCDYYNRKRWKKSA